MKLTISFLAALVATVVGAQPASASTIDTTGFRFGGLSPFGAPDTATFGQTFTVHGPDLRLDSFSLFLGPRLQFDTSETLDLRGYVASFDSAGYRADTILFESATRTTSAGGELEEFVFSPDGLVLSEGQRYVAFLSISNLPAQPAIAFEMPMSVSVLGGEEYVFLNSGNDFSLLTSTRWDGGSVNGNDFFFKATLSAVPEPSGLLLLGLGLAGLASWRRASPSPEEPVAR
ncbi:MAG: PEP-CTERM sorting domain-containing protein [Myxococcota bacterium]